MRVQKDQQKQSKSPALKKNLKNQNIKAVAKTDRVKNVRAIMTAEAIVRTTLADVVL